MLKIEELNKLKKNYSENPTNKIKERMLNKVQLIDLIQDETTKLTNDFNINIKTHNVTDQESSGRCWAFAELNILREKVITKCNLDNFELSASFIAFYDKLERFNILLERLITYKKDNKGLYDRYVAFLLEIGMTDGGYFSQISNLIKKYGIVPKSVYPETYTSANTYEINLILSRLIRKFYLDLENSEDSELLKSEYMEKAFNIIANVYGVPNETFNFEYTDKNGDYHIDKNLTPKDFYNKYIGLDLTKDYVEIASYQDEKYKYNNLYEEEESSRISGENNNITLNINPKDFKDLVIKQLNDNEPVYFYASTTAKRIDGIWVDTIKRYGEIFDVDLELDNNSIIKTNGSTNNHTMIITGVNIVDNKPTKWKIENSWGNKVGNLGYYIATDDWFNKYVYRIVINKKHLTPKQLEVLNKEPIKFSKWDTKF
ncbi:MAG: hypothetical protein NC483_02010 [Ruminococcus sp.]|nr:hypothetical protein [Ruminococcus sp.]